jgi:hypothetical protein
MRGRLVVGSLSVIVVSAAGRGSGRSRLALRNPRVMVVVEALPTHQVLEPPTSQTLFQKALHFEDVSLLVSVTVSRFILVLWILNIQLFRILCVRFRARLVSHAVNLDLHRRHLSWYQTLDSAAVRDDVIA